METQMGRTQRYSIFFTLMLLLEWGRWEAGAAEFEPLGKAVAAALGTKSAFKKSFSSDGKPVTLFYAKGSEGKATKFAFVQKGVYEPNCTHTWVVGVDATTGKVSEVRVVEMSCPHAYPAKTGGFLGQFKGKGPADAATLKQDIVPVAKATGSANLTTDAVRRSLVAASKLRGKI